MSRFLCTALALIVLCLVYTDAQAMRQRCTHYGAVCESGPNGEAINCVQKAPTCEWVFDAGDFGGPTGGTGSPPDYIGDPGGGGTGPTDQAVADKAREKEKPKNCDEITNQPVVIATGNKLKAELDFVIPPNNVPLGVSRFYDKSLKRSGIFGPKWSSNIEYTLGFVFGGTMCRGMLNGVTTCTGNGQPLEKINAYRPSGYAFVFSKGIDGIWRDDNDNSITQMAATWALSTPEGNVEVYDAHGRPVTIQDERGIGLAYGYANNRLATLSHTSGRSIGFTWNASPVYISTVTAPSGKVYSYSYAGDHLSGVSYPDGLGQRTYHYEDAAQNHGLTGISIDNIRYSRYSYYPDGRVKQSGIGNNGDIDRSSFVYGVGYTDVTNALGQTSRHLIAEIDGSKRIIGVERPASATCPASARYSAYDARNNVDYELDAFDVKSDYTFDLDDRLVERTIGIGPNGETDQQQITRYAWDPGRKNRLLSIKTYGSSLNQPISEITYTYFPDGDAHARLLKALTVINLSPQGLQGNARTTTYSYTLHPNKMVATITVDGPLPGTGDAVVSTYDATGNLTAIQNGLGHTISYANYNAIGLVGRVTGVNGGITDYAYDAQGNVTKVRTYIGGVGADTINVYTSLGLLESTTAIDGSSINYEYDSARRVTRKYAIATGVIVGGAMQEDQIYTYNINNDITRVQNRKLTGHYEMQCKHWINTQEGPECLEEEQVLVLQPTLVSSTFMDYDNAGFIQARRGNNGRNIRYIHNANGDLASQADSLDRVTGFIYDRQRRINKIMDAKQGVTEFKYDTGDRLTWVKDPRGKITTYAYDGFGELWKQTSPDTGPTSFQYNAAGQQTKLTRADGGTLDFTYADPLGRLTQISRGYEARYFSYDWCAWGKAQLCGITATNSDGTTGSYSHFAYRPEGQLWKRFDVALGGEDLTTYAYDGMGRLTGIGYPSGVAVGYGYASGKLTTMIATVNGTTVNVATGLKYQPFGPVASWTYGNGLNRGYNHDLDGRLTGISTVAGGNVQQSLTYAYNANDLITALTNGTDAGNSHKYEYDELARLSKDTLGGNLDGSVDSFDAVGNRISRGSSAAGVPPTTQYTISATSNRVLGQIGNAVRNFSYTPQGHLLSSTGWLGNRSYAYDAFDRLKSTTLDGAPTTYTTNAQDQRVGKTTGGVTTRFVYAGQNQLLAEQGPNGWKSYLYLFGQPVAVVNNASNTLYFIHTDHLGRPEAATHWNQLPVWKATNGSYSRGVTLDTIGGINLGFPGQYWDAETSTWYNGFRDYDPYLGRYIQSDPIGLAGGLNTYAYVGSNPVNGIDPLGLWCIGKDAKNAASGATGAMVGMGFASRGNPYAIAGAGVVGAGVGYYAGPAASSTITGGLSAVAAGPRNLVVFTVGALAGGLTEGSGGQPFAGGTIGAIEGVLNSPIGSAARATTYGATLGPAVKGGLVGAAAASASKAVEGSIDFANAHWGDCGCDGK